MAMEMEVPRHVWVPQLAKRIIVRHRTDGRCDQCRDDGCPALDWARERLATYRSAAPPTG
jgi:hypothetical protein